MKVAVLYHVTDAELARDFRQADQAGDVERLAELIDAFPLTADTLRAKEVKR